METRTSGLGRGVGKHAGRKTGSVRPAPTSLSLGQYQLVRLLTGPEANLFVVGDDAQSIYEWRSANYKRLSEAFYADFPQAKQIVLEDNFRSTQQIIDASTALVERKHVYVRTTSHRGEGPLVQDVRVQTDRDEAVFVTNELKRLSREYGLEWKDMAVLMRTNAQSVPFQQEMLLQGIPHTLLQGQRLYARREVRDMLAYLSVAHDGDEAYLAQIINSPPRGLGPNALRVIKGASLQLTWNHIFTAMNDGEALGLRQNAVDSLKAFYDFLMDLTARTSTDKPDDLIDYIVEAGGYRKWLQSDLEDQSKASYIDVLKQEASEYGSVGEFLEAIRQKINQNEVVEGDNGVVLSTIHTVKGLEFSAVFVVGMEEGLLPHKKAAKGSTEEGERRLAFVAFTRAVDHLYLVSSRRRCLYGRWVEHRPSRYLFDLPPALVEVKRW